MHFKTLFLMTILLAGCGATPQQVVATATQPTPAPTPTHPPTPINTDIPTATSIPGFEDWSVLNPQAVDIKVENSSLILTLKQHALWFMEQRGVLMYKLTVGNFKITADIHTAKNSDPTHPPGGNGSVQLGGLMARNGNFGRENYVFIVAGDDGNGLSIETKNTTNSESVYDGPAWDSADAELRLCRFGQTFYLYKRHVNSNETWIPAKTFERPDLPDELQVGVNIYTDGKPDVQIHYDNISIESISTTADCETN